MFFLAFHSGKIAVLRKEKGVLHVDHLRTIGENVKPLDILKSTLRKKRYTTVTGLATHAVLSRTLSLKLKTKRELLAALPFQVESLLPHAYEDLILLANFDRGKEETKIFLLASSKKEITSHLQRLEAIELDPDTVSCVPLALLRFAHRFFPKYSTAFIHYAENDQHTFAVVKDNRLVASQSHKSQDFERVLAYMQKKYPDILHILNFAKNIPSTSLTVLEVTNPNLAEYAIPIGLALDAAANDGPVGQFRQETFSKKMKAKKSFQRLSYAIACSCFIFSTLFLGYLSQKKEEKALKEALNCPNDISLGKVIAQLEQTVYQQKKTLVNIPTIPKVNQVLAWLSNHPQLNANCSITHLVYQITKSPRLGSKVQTYGAKVEIELTIPQAATAHAFHDALLKDHAMIEQKDGVQWSANHGTYRASFSLKPRLR